MTAVLSIILSYLAFALPAQAAVTGPPTLVSDQADYPPGGLVHLTGENWAPGETVTIKVDDAVGQSWSLTSGLNGAAASPVATDLGHIEYDVQLPAWFVSDYTAVATAPSGTATVTFTDSAVQKFDQCANDQGSGYPASSSDPGCQWINGNLQQSNSVYNEGDATPQRLALTGLNAGTTYTLVFTYQTSKGGLHAYDYLTTYKYSETWINDQCQGLTPCSSTNVSTYPIPTTTPQSSGQSFTMYGGTMTNAAIAMPTNYAGDTIATVTLTFTATGGDSVLWFGGHVASQLDWGNGQGAGSINGSPYHVSLVSLNGASLGSMDNQMAAGAVQTAGSVKVVKDAVPNSAQDFSFTLTNAAGTQSKTFGLDDDADPTLPSSQAFNVAPGSWTVTENPAASPWSLTDLTCTGGTFTKSGATATLTVVSNQTITCTYTNTYVYKDLVVTKTATPSFDRAYTWTIAKSVDNTTVNTTSGGSATFNYTVTATPTAHDSKFAVSGVITVKNPNDVPVSAVSLADAMTGVTCSITGTTTGITVAAGATLTFPYTCTFATKPAGDLTNTATATWTQGSPYGTSGSASGTATTNFADAKVTVTGGQTITVTDDKTDPANPVVLGTADATDAKSQVYTYTLTKTAPNGSCASYKNNAWLGTDTAHPASQTVTVCGGSGLEVSKTATPSYTRDWAWDVTKVAGSPRVIADATTGQATATYTVTATPTKTDSAWTVSGTITLRNPNSIALGGVTVTDALPGATCTLGAVPASIAAGATVTVDYTCTFASAPSAGTLTNTVTASWADSGFVKAGSISATASTTFAGLAPSVEHGATTEVTDPNAATGLPATATAPAGGTYQVTATWTNQNPGTCQTFTNTATVTGDSASADVEVCRAADLKVSKTATGHYDTTYAWAIDKKLADVPGTIPSGTTVDYPYTLTVTKAGQTDSGWVVTGQITVSNPNTWQAVTLTGVIDGLSVEGATCTVDGGPGSVVAASKSVTLDYTCTYAAKPTAYEGTNTATATWNAAAAHTANDAASGGAAYTLALMGQTNKTVTVTDTQHESWTLDWATAAASTDLDYTLTRTAPEASCATFENTAAVVGDNGVRLGSDSVSQELCGASPLKVDKTAVAGYTQTYPWTITKSVDKSRIVVGEGGDTKVTYTVDVTRGTPTPTAWTLTGDIVVHNPNNFESITATVTDGVGIDGLTCSITGDSTITVEAGKDVTLHYTCAVAAGANPGTLSGTNTATATWDATAAHTAVGTARGTAGVTGTLTGSVDESITVTDPMAPGGVVGTFTGTGSKSYDVTLAGTAGACQTIDNTATITETGQSDKATVDLCIVKAPTASKTAAGTFTRTYPWTIAKDVDKTQINVAPDGSATFTYTVTATQGTPVDSGWAMTGTVTVTNPNAFPISATVTDTLTGCTVANGGVVTVGANASADVAVTCTGLTAAESSNTASVTWTAQTDSGQYSGAAVSGSTSSIDWAETPVDKSVEVFDNKTGTDPMSLGTAQWGDGKTPVTFTYEVTKDAGAAGTCSTYDNRAWVKTDANDSYATQSVKVCVGADLQVEKTAVGSYDTTYAWSVAKSLPDTVPGAVVGGTSVNLPYTVTATKTGQVDSAWTVKGAITVTNPNTWQDVTLSGVTDSLSVEGATCTITGDKTATIAKNSGSVTLDYVCTYAVKPAEYAGTNTATATWDQAAAYTASGSASGTAAYALALVGETNKTVTVIDTYNGGTPETLGTATISESPKSFTVDKSVVVPAGSCVTVRNAVILTGDNSVVLGGDSVDKTICGGADLTVTKTATGGFTRTYKWLIDKSVAPGQAEQTIPAGASATADYGVTVTPNGYEDSAWSVTGVITVSNPNSWEAITATVTESGDGLGVAGMTCTVGADKTSSVDVSVAAGKTATVPYECTGTPTAYPASANVAKVTWDAATAFTPSGAATTGSVPVTLGQTSGNDTITVTDTPKDGTTVTLGTWKWADGEHTFTYTKSYAGVPGTCTTYDNTATITETNQSDSQAVKVCVGQDVTVSKTAAGAYTRTYLWTVAKKAAATQVNVAPNGDAVFAYTVTATPNGYTDSAYSMGGTITVTNPNDFQSVTVDVTDVPNVGGGAMCTVADGMGVVIEAGKSVELTYTCTLGAPTSYTAGTNTATVKVTAGTVKTASVNSAAVPVAFATGTEVDKTVQVYDDKTVSGGSNVLGTAEWNAAGTPVEFPYSVTQQPTAVGDCTGYTNTAWIDLAIATDPTSSVTVKACVGADLTVSKTATTSFSRDYKWKIAKSVTPDYASIPAGTTKEVTYGVTVTKDGYTDRAWQLSGTITVTNPNTWQDVVANVTDVVDVGGGAACTVTNGDRVTIAAGKSVKLNYSCTFTGKPAYTGTNTATATWDKNTYATANGSANGTAPVTFGAPANGDSNQVITVTDTPLGGTKTTLGTLDYETMAGESFTFPAYTAQFTAPKGTCDTHTNTATITETGQDATASTKLCGFVTPTASKSATGAFDRGWSWAIVKNADQTDLVANPATGKATANYTVTATASKSDSGATVSGTITVTNSNDVALPVSVTDAIGDTACTVTPGAGSIPAKGSFTAEYLCALPTVPTGVVNNVATVTWTGVDYVLGGSATPSASVDFAAVVPTQTGATNTFTDSLFPGKTFGPFSATRDGQEFVEHYSYEWTVDAGKCTTVHNTATLGAGGSDGADVTICREAPVTATKTGALAYQRDWTWAIEKKATESKLVADSKTGTVKATYTVTVTPTKSEHDAVVSGSVTVSNPNSIDLPVTVTDSIGNTTCTVTDPQRTVPAGGSLDFGYRCAIGAVPTADVTNTANVSWAATGYIAAGSTKGSTTIPVSEFTAEVSGNGVTVSDPKAPDGTLGTFWGDNGATSVNYDATWTGTPGTCVDYTNTATIDQTKASDSATVTVCEQADVTASKSMTTSYARDYSWAVEKSVDKTRIDTTSGGEAIFTYTVTATPTAHDSGFVAKGVIKVTNPNGVALTDVSVTENLAGCSVSGQSTGLTVAANGTLDVPVNCIFGAATDATNTATVSWGRSDYVKAGSTNVEGAVTFGAPTTVTDDKVTITDDKTTGVQAPLFDVDVAKSDAWSITYPVTKTAPNGACVDYTNTAVGPDNSVDATVKLCGAAAVTASKSVTTSYNRDYTWALTKTVDPAAVNVAAGQSVDLTYTVTATPTMSESDFAGAGTITVTNPNNVALTGVSVTEHLAACTVDGASTGLTVPAATVTGPGTLKVPVTCTFTSKAATTNTATVAWAKSEYVPAGSTEVSASIAFGDPNTIGHPTDTVYDPMATGNNDPLFTATATDSSTWTKSYKVTKTAPAGSCLTFRNEAKDDATSVSVDATICGAAAVTAEKSATGTFNRKWDWTIKKSTDQALLYGDASGNATANYTVTVTPTKTDSGAVVSGTITVTNPNDVALPVTVTDSMGAGSTCTLDPASGTTVPAKSATGPGVLTVKYTCTLAPVPTGVVTNTATVTWPKTDYVPSGNTSPTASVDFGKDVTPVVTGDGVTFSDPASPNGATAYGPFYGADGAKTTTYTHGWNAAPGTCTTNPNTATLSTGATSTATVKVCTGMPLQVEKSAATSMTRTYVWDIAKSNPVAPKPTLAGSLSVPYQVKVTPNGFTDSAWKVTGTITVTNPNKWQSVTVKSVTDQLDASIGGSCTVTGGTTAKELLAGATATYAYTCTFATKPASYTGTNTATAIWDATVAHTATGSATGTAPVNFENGTITHVNQSITVTDQVTGSTTVKTLGTADWSTGITPAAGITKVDQWTFGYSNTYAVPTNGCKSYTNTAKITQTGQTSAVTVNVCGPPNLGDGTIGFWSNKNGQAIITGTASTAGVCKVTAFLRGFAPLQDLSATATCTQVNAYVQNVIKAANASGSTMNAMLKAQFLAAALNYYYTSTDPRRAGSNLSLLTFDISQWSAGFGGATKMTLLQMLTYASSQSNVGGTIWYAQNKTIQGYAKDAFMAVNMSRILLAPTP